MSLDPIILAFPSEHVTDVPLRSLVIESTLREELLGSPFTSVTDDVNIPPGPQVWVLRSPGLQFSVLRGLFRL